MRFRIPPCLFHHILLLHCNYLRSVISWKSELNRLQTNAKTHVCVYLRPPVKHPKFRAPFFFILFHHTQIVDDLQEFGPCRWPQNLWRIKNIKAWIVYCLTLKIYISGITRILLYVISQIPIFSISKQLCWYNWVCKLPCKNLYFIGKIRVRVCEIECTLTTNNELDCFR